MCQDRFLKKIAITRTPEYYTRVTLVILLMHFQPFRTKRKLQFSHFERKYWLIKLFHAWLNTVWAIYGQTLCTFILLLLPTCQSGYFIHVYRQVAFITLKFVFLHLIYSISTEKPANKAAIISKFVCRLRDFPQLRYKSCDGFDW